MNVTISLPEDIATVLSSDIESVERSILEAFALENYRSGKFSQAQVRRLLGFSTDMEVDAFLKEHGIFLEYDLEDIEREAAFSLTFMK
jgi:hypothetical protein